MNNVLENIKTFADGAWEFIAVILVIAIAWYILQMALEAYKQGNIKKVLEGISGWMIVMIFGGCVAIPMSLYMFGSVFDQVTTAPALETVKVTVSESARFTADMVDGDGEVTMPNIPSPARRSSEPIVIRNAPQPTQPAAAPTLVPTPVVHNPSAAPTLAPWTPPTPVGQQPKTVTVGRGDTLFKIAKRLWGDGEKWRDLCNHNFGGNKRQCDRLSVGQVINIP